MQYLLLHDYHVLSFVPCLSLLLPSTFYADYVASCHSFFLTNWAADSTIQRSRTYVTLASCPKAVAASRRRIVQCENR